MLNLRVKIEFLTIQDIIFGIFQSFGIRKHQTSKLLAQKPARMGQNRSFSGNLGVILAIFELKY